MTMSVSTFKVSALPLPGIGQVFTQSLFFSLLSSSHTDIRPLALPLHITGLLSWVVISNSSSNLQILTVLSLK